MNVHSKHKKSTLSFEDNLSIKDHHPIILRYWVKLKLQMLLQKGLSITLKALEMARHHNENCQSDVDSCSWTTTQITITPNPERCEDRQNTAELEANKTLQKIHIHQTVLVGLLLLGNGQYAMIMSSYTVNKDEEWGWWSSRSIQMANQLIYIYQISSLFLAIQEVATS